MKAGFDPHALQFPLNPDPRPCVSVQVTLSLRCTISLLTFPHLVPVDATTPTSASASGSTWPTTTRLWSLTFSGIPLSPAHCPPRPSRDTLRSSRRRPKLWNAIKTPSQPGSYLMMPTGFQTKWRGKRFCGNPGSSRAVGPFPSVAAKRTPRIQHKNKNKVLPSCMEWTISWPILKPFNYI